MDYHAIALDVLKRGHFTDGALIMSAYHIQDGRFSNDAALRVKNGDVILVVACVATVKFNRHSQFGGALYQCITGNR